MILLSKTDGIEFGGIYRAVRSVGGSVRSNDDLIALRNSDVLF